MKSQESQDKFKLNKKDINTNAKKLDLKPEFK